ncbi:MAG: hypothetical protein WC775_06475 [Patescibacteria group bacterium]|jgi:hypothetical protein
MKLKKMLSLLPLAFFILFASGNLCAGIKGGGGAAGSGTTGNAAIWATATTLTDTDVNETELLNLRTITNTIGTEFGQKTFDDVVTGEWLYDVCVNGDTGSDTAGDGSWASPFKTIQYAIDLLPKNVDTNYFYLNVGDGTYSIAPYYTDLTDYNTVLVSLTGFHGKGKILLNFTAGAILKLTGAHDADVASSAIFSIESNSCKIYIYGDGTLLSLEETSCPANLHNKFFSVTDGYVDIDDFVLEVNQTYSAGSVGTYDFSPSGYGYLAVTDCVYTVGKEGYRTFYGFNNSMSVITDGKLVGATAMFGYGTTNAYFLSGTNYYQVLDAGLWLDDGTGNDSQIVTNEQLALLNTYAQTEANLATAVSQSHAGSHAGTSGYMAKFTDTNTVADSIYEESDIVKGVGVDTITASATEPGSPVEGDIWIDTSYVYRQVLSGSASSDTGINLLGGARITYYNLTISGDVTAETPIFNGGKTPEDGDSLIIRVLASGAARTLDLLVGGTGTFLYGSTLVSTDITQTVQNKYDYIGCVYDANKSKWCVLSYSKGY